MQPIEKLKAAQDRLRLNQRQMAMELNITPEWYSKVVKGRRPASIDLMLRLDALLVQRGIDLSLFKLSGLVEPNAPGGEPRGSGHSRNPLRQEPSTRADCERYMRGLMDAADSSGDPNAFPVILHRLRKEFPLSEWSTEHPK